MEILRPQLGETVVEGKITIWFKAIGDAIKCAAETPSPWARFRWR
jgi:pyruvate/2-oxoglutarate dehydrogenase complex dihydrolipoamide acyltransferase (E2) component